MRRKQLARSIFKLAFVILILLDVAWLLLPSRFAGATAQVIAREKSANVSAPAAQATIQPLPTRPPTPVGAPTSVPEVPEGDTLLLFGGGLGGLAAWLGWQWRNARQKKN